MRAETRHEARMGRKPQHPITTPKGANLLTVVLTVIGAFIPFFTGLEAAQVVAGMAVLIIVWLYWSEFGDVYAKRVAFGRLTLPLCAIAIIVGVALAATYKVGSQPRPPAALTPADIASIVEESVNRKATIGAPVNAPPVVDRNVTYQTIIEARDPPPLRTPPKAPPPKISDNDPIMASLRKQTNRLRAGYNEELKCNSEVSAVRQKAYSLSATAVKMQNEYGYNRNNKRMVSDLALWIADVEKFFSENAKRLPDVSVFRLANSEQRANTFLGLNNSGENAWASMDAKRRVLEVTASNISFDECKKIKVAAVEQCEAKGDC